jgi:integrase
MSLVKRSKGYSLAIRPFGRQVWVSTGLQSKTRAQDIERQILVACKSNDYSFLDAEARAIAITMYQNQGWDIPTSLGGETHSPDEILTLWRGIELCKKDPSMKASKNKERQNQAFAHLVTYFGKEFPLKSMWISDIKQYQFERQAAGAAASTINKEKSALSRIFEVLIELRILEANPARMVKILSERDGLREIYISHEDFQRMLGEIPDWYRPIVQVAYYTGMRRGEILNLTRDRLNLKERMIYLRSGDTKEGKKKRVPIHRDLVPILEDVMKSRGLTITPHIFLKDGVPLTKPTQVRWCWRRPVDKIEGLANVRFHDLRATWKSNAMRSGIDFEIREAIMGHSNRVKNVSERYGSISEETLVRAIDQMTFKHGESEIWIAKKAKHG